MPGTRGPNNGGKEMRCKIINPLDQMSTDEAPPPMEAVLKRFIRDNRKLKKKNKELNELNWKLLNRISYLRFIIKRVGRSREKMRARFFLLFDEKHGLDFSRDEDR